MRVVTMKKVPAWVILCVIALVAGAALGTTNALTKGPIAEQAAKAAEEACAAVLPAAASFEHITLEEGAAVDYCYQGVDASNNIVERCIRDSINCDGAHGCACNELRLQRNMVRTGRAGKAACKKGYALLRDSLRVLVHGSEPRDRVVRERNAVEADERNICLLYTSLFYGEPACRIWRSSFCTAPGKGCGQRHPHAG